MISKSQIIKKIEKLYYEGEPLNISAVKRHSPKLIEAAYSFKNFWGWKQAIDETGLKYYKLKAELLESATCQICGFQGGILTSHLNAEHGLSTAQYRKKFPQAEIMSERIRAERSNRSGAPLIHWEPIWTPEYVLDRIFAYHQYDLPLNYFKISQQDRGLAGNALLFFGSWDKALQKVGFDPNSIRAQQTGVRLSEKEVIEQLKLRYKKGLPLNSAQLEKEDLRLSNAARRRFGSYQKALAAAKIPHEAVLKKIDAHPDTLIQEILTEAEKVAALDGLARYEAMQVLHQKYGKKIRRISSLTSWREVASQLKVPIVKFSTGKYAECSAVADALMQRQQKGLSLQASRVFDEDRSLYSGIRNHFETHEDACYFMLKRKKDLDAL